MTKSHHKIVAGKMLGASAISLIIGLTGVGNANAQEAGSAVAAIGSATGTVVAFQILPEGSDRQVDPFNIEAKADSLVATPVLSVGLVDSVQTVVRGEEARFVGYNNYPSYVSRAEICIHAEGQSADATPLATVPLDSNGVAIWRTPADLPENLWYNLRVYDAQGRFDETRGQILKLLDKAPAEAEKPTRPEFGSVDEAQRRNIPVRGVMLDVSGANLASGDVARIDGLAIPADDKGHFAARLIVPREAAHVRVSVERNGTEIHSTTRSFVVPRNEWFVVGQGDITFGTTSSKGPASEVSGDTLTNGDFAIGRAAFYAKGVVANEVQVTAALDTGEARLKDIFSNLDRKDPRQLFRRLDSDQYYPTYGDDSTLVEDAPTQGRFYFRAKRQDSQIMFGNFSTAIQGAELAQLDRGLFGGLFDYRSSATTNFGERKTQVTAFASDPGTIPGRDEFRGTGGSLYYLKRQDVSVGSERLRIEIRDRNTGVVLESSELHPQEDYDFDPFQGRVTLLRPLSSYATTTETVRTGASSGNIPVLVVRYEYSPAVGSLSGYTIGGRGTQWLGDLVRLGVTAQRETLDSADQTLIAGDAMLRLTAGTYLKAELAQTDGPGFGQSASIDGGLNFTDTAAVGLRGIKAKAWRTEGAVNIAELQKVSGDRGKIRGFYEHFDAGFSSVGRLMTSETERWGVGGNLPLGTTTDIVFAWDELASADTGRSRTGTADLSQKLGVGLTGKLGLRLEDRVPNQLYNSVQSGRRIDAAVEIAYDNPSTNWGVHAFGQGTLERDAGRLANNRIGIGAKATLTERLSASGEASVGTGGLGLDLKLNHKLDTDSEAYVGYRLDADRTDIGLSPQNLFGQNERGTFTVGARRRFSDSLAMHGEQRLGHGGTAPSLIRSYGLEFTPDKHFSVNGAIENGRIDDATSGVIKRTAASLTVGYTTDKVRAGSGVELRSDRGAGRQQTVWLFRNSVDYAVDPDWRAIGRLNFAFADEGSPSVNAANFVEGVVGMAFRPVENERVNGLVRLTYFRDLGPIGQVTGGGTTESPKQISKVANIDFNFNLSERLTLGLKYGYRQGKVSLGRNSDTYVKSDTHLGVARLDYRVARNWDVLGEVRYLSTPLADSNRWGLLGAIYRHLGDNVKIGVGYGTSKYSDDLTDQSYSSRGPFINLLGKY
ncbi:MAG: hypothetical protein IPN50_09045 [Sphingomonadales bacterium]|nr:hypothetical protein [Sphingomonadales bacterium]